MSILNAEGTINCTTLKAPKFRNLITVESEIEKKRIFYLLIINPINQEVGKKKFQYINPISLFFQEKSLPLKMSKTKKKVTIRVRIKQYFFE